jgi:hypothetical protein
VLHVDARHLTAGALAVAAVAACSEEPIVIDNDTPAWGDSIAWTIGAAPALIAGRQPEDLDALLSAGDAARTAHGRIAVTAQALDQLRIYDPAGSLVATAGGPGSGMFRSIGSVWIRPGDTIAVASVRSPAVQFFDPDGKLLSTVDVKASANTLFVTPLAQFADGSILAQSLVPGPVLPELGRLLRDTLAFLRIQPDGRTVRSMLRVAGPREIVFDDGGGKRQIAAPFPLTASGATAGDDLVFGNGETPEFEIAGPDGRVRRIVRWNAPPVAITPEIEQRYRHSAIGENPSEQTASIFDSFTRQAGFPDAMPVYNGIVTDEDGFTWLRAYAPPWALDEPETWTVFDPAGRWLGSLPMPPGFRPTRFGNQFVLGLLDSPDGYRQVALFTLDRNAVRPPSPPAGPARPPAVH